MSTKLTNNIYQFEDNETGWGSQMNQNLKALDDTIGELKNVYKKTEVDTELSNKQDKLTSTQTNAINSGIDSTKVSGYDNHVSDTDIHVTTSDKANWNAKPNKSTTLSGYGITNAYTKTEVDNAIKDFATKSTTLGGYGITDAYTKTEIDTKLSSVYKYKGSVDQYLDLPTQNNVVGDVWNVSSNGMNYAWDGATWDNLGATVDLSSYVKNTDYATTSKGGVVKSSSDSATDVVNGVLQATTKTTTQYNSADNSMFVSKGTLNNVLTSKDYATNTSLSAKANTSDVYTQSEVNNLVNKKADTTSVYTKTQIDSSLSGKQDKLSATQLSNIADVPNKANASDIYDKTELDDKFNAKQDSLTQVQLNAVNSGITSTKVTNLETHASNSNIHVTTSDKNLWNGKQDALTSDQIANINSIPQFDSKYIKSDDTTIIKLNNLNEINLQEDHYNAWFGYRGGEVTNWKFGNGSEGGYADVYANDYYLNDEKLSDKLDAKQNALTDTQLSACNSGITSDKVATYDGYATSKANDSDVVHTTGNETINGIKTFTSRLTYKGTNTIAGDNTSGNFAGSFNFTDKNNVQMGLLGFGVYNNYGYTEQSMSIINPAWFNDDAKPKNFVVRLRVMNTGEASFTPASGKAIDLGTESSKWKSFNGLNPGALSLPSGTVSMNLIGNVSVVDAEKKLSKVISVNGFVYVDVSFTSNNILNLYNNTKKYGIWLPCSNGRIRQIMPISANDTLEFNVLDDGSTINSIQVFSCQGNV